MSSFFDSASLVQIPSGIKEGTLYSVKPIDGSGDLTFSRGSDIEATRVNANGYIEKAQVNLLTYSNDFNGAGWSVVSATMTGGQAGYDGTNDAWLFDSTAGYIASSPTVSGVATLSVYAKKGTADGIRLRIDAATDANCYIDLNDGTEIAAYSGIALSIVSVGSGWYRIALSINDSSIANVRFYAIDDTGASTTGTVYIQDAQVNYGLVAQDYQETTTAAVVSGITDNMPRLNYDLANPTCPSLLLEPSRTNLIPHSEYFGAWTLGGTTTIDFGYLAPDGTNSAYKVTNVSSGSISYSGVVNQNYSRTIYARTTSGTGTAQLCSYFGNTNNIFTITEEWQRFEVNTTTTATGATNFYGIDFRGVGTLSEIILWGAQSENASYASSYIPTYGSSATRTAESCSKTGISSLIGQTEGTFFAEVDFTDTNSDQMYLTLSDGTTNNRIHIGFSDASNWIYCNIRSGGASQGLITQSSPSAGIKKIAVGYKLNDYVMYINGVQVGVDSSALVPACSRLDVGGYLTAGQEYPVKQALLFTTRLTNAQLAELTA